MYAEIELTPHCASRLNQRDCVVSKDKALEISTSPSLAIVRPSQAQVRNLWPSVVPPGLYILSAKVFY